MLPMQLGNMLDWYEFGTYGYVSDQITSNFFRGASALTWADFGLTFLCRPIGGYIFGRWGDVIGRKNATYYAICGMTFATVAEGCLPSYHVGGENGRIAGAVLLTVFRMIQGLCTGGEIGGVIVYCGESGKGNCLGLLCSLITSTAAFAFALSAGLISLLNVLLDEEQMNLWGWRIPFLLALPPGILCLRWLHDAPESDEFLNYESKLLAGSSPSSGDESDMPHGTTTDDTASRGKDDYAERLPLSSSYDDEGSTETVKSSTIIWRSSDFPIAIFHAFMATAACAAIWYVGAVYIVAYMENLGVPGAVATAGGALDQLVYSFSVPLGGVLVDIFGAQKMHLISSILIMLGGYPIFLWVYLHPTVSVAYWSQIVLGLFQGGTTASIYLYIIRLFPLHIRQQGIGLSYNLALGIFGGCGPLLVEMLANIYGCNLCAGYYISVLGLLSTCTLCFFALSSNHYMA